MNRDAAVAIGIPVRGKSPWLDRTVEALRATAPQARLVLLDVLPRDGAADSSAALPDEAPVDEADPLRVVCDRPGGNAACFNFLVRSVYADVYVLFENGATPAAGWLTRLLATFTRVARCGLTGPSTNRCWNEQAAVPSAPEIQAAPDPAPAARAVERRFGSSRRSLRPLHSLSDFCYAVRREVIEAIGDADENYPAGNCWEMDYNIRAHRAGFLSVWTCAAYVERAPALRPEEPAPDDPQQFTASKHRYQDKFCGGRLRGKKTDYREHCRGDACPNFAPPDLIQIRLDRHAGLAPAPLCDSWTDDASLDSRQPAPLVSCIMPTCNRRAFLPAALACFAAQDYSNLELIVVDDGSDPIADLLPSDPRIRYFRLGGKLNTGAKRNFACEQAHGSFIAHWDDDDWYPPSRIRIQIDAMRGAHWQVSGSTTMYYLHHERDQAFRYTYRGSGRAWLGALLYTKPAWERHRFDEIQIGEDVRFLARIPFADRLDLNDPALTIGTIHGANTSPKVTSGPYWSAEPPEKIRALMRPREVPSPAAPPLPLISCIMPTHNRRAFIGLALACFDAQTYPSRELVVIDDGSDPVGDLLEGRPGVRYARISTRITLGAKRNLACEIAQGDLIAHWDDDDWYNPRRLSEQIAPLLAQQCDITGLVTTHVLEMPFARFWTLSGDLHHRMFMGDVVGGTLMFAKSLLRQGIRYPEMNLAEDAALIRQFTQRRKRVQRIPNPGLFVYVRHGHNTWLFDPGRFVDPRGWRVTAAPPEFPSAALDSYRAACLQSSCR
jgi:glycosyltransferase involved in cell wall biosynthesis